MLTLDVFDMDISFSLVSRSGLSPSRRGIRQLGGLVFWEWQQLMRDIVLLESSSSSTEVNNPSVN